MLYTLCSTADKQLFNRIYTLSSHLLVPPNTIFVTDHTIHYFVNVLPDWLIVILSLECYIAICIDWLYVYFTALCLFSHVEVRFDISVIKELIDWLIAYCIITLQGSFAFIVSLDIELVYRHVVQTQHRCDRLIGFGDTKPHGEIELYMAFKKSLKLHTIIAGLPGLVLILTSLFCSHNSCCKLPLFIIIIRHAICLWCNIDINR